MDIVRNPKIDWLGKKWFFIGASLLFGLVGVVSLLGLGGLNLGVDFTGGTLVYVKFKDSPDLQRIRNALNQADLNAESVTRFDEEEMNEVQIRMARVESEEVQDLSLESRRVRAALKSEFDEELSPGDRIDLNQTSTDRMARWLQEKDHESRGSELSLTEFVEYTEEVAGRITDFRNRQRGLIRDFSELSQIDLPEPVIAGIEQDFYLGSFNIISVESVGPKVGSELRERARSAVVFSLLGMLIYIAFRFRPIYGVAAIAALFHDVFLTLGFFSLTGKEISLTVVAALLTLVGYSINDTIVVFDRVRENQKLMRRASYYTIINTSINQTLNRTIMTSGMTFLAVFALLMFGGEALSGFSTALVVGIVVGTYSSIAIASPIVLWWQNFTEKRRAKA
jgi:preprotein translocase subunit SecF